MNIENVFYKIQHPFKFQITTAANTLKEIFFDLING